MFSITPDAVPVPFAISHSWMSFIADPLLSSVPVVLDPVDPAEVVVDCTAVVEDDDSSSPPHATPVPATAKRASSDATMQVRLFPDPVRAAMGCPPSETLRLRDDTPSDGFEDANFI